MSATFMSASAFDWFLGAVTGVVAALWLVYDGINIARLRKADAADPVVRDKRFGYVIGLVIALVGIIGVGYHHLGHHVG
jgi:uncharacterized membrane protein